MKMKPASLFTFTFTLAMLFMVGVALFAVDRTVQAEYELKATHSSTIASRIAQYEHARVGQTASTFTAVDGTNVILFMTIATLMFTAVHKFMGKDGLTGVLRQVNRMKPKRSRPRPSTPHTPTAVHPVNALPPPTPMPQREAFTPTAVNAQSARNEEHDGIQWT
jgi:hypothetical protein